MSQFPPNVSSQVIRESSNAMAIAALVCGIVGLLIPLVGLVAIILGIIALLRSRSRGGVGKAPAIIGLVLGVLGFLAMCLVWGIFLPALGKARNSAQMLKSQTQLRVIGQALQVYANVNKDWYIETDKDWSDRLIKVGAIDDLLLHAPGASSGMQSYFYVPGYKMEFKPDRIIAFEHPDLWRNGSVAVFYDDGHVDRLSREQWQIVAPNIRTPDGKTYAPYQGK